jgi:hypothetical protein
LVLFFGPEENPGALPLSALLKDTNVGHPWRTPGLPGGRHHGHFPQMWQFKKVIDCGKFVAVSGRPQRDQKC